MKIDVIILRNESTLIELHRTPEAAVKLNFST